MSSAMDVLPKSVDDVRAVANGVLLVLGLLFTAHRVQVWWRLRQFKGPWIASISSVWMIKSILSGKNGELYREANQKYGSLARIGSNDLITDDPDIIKHMSAARSTWRRSEWYDAMSLNPYNPDVLSTRDTAAHDKLKAMMASGYAGKENPTLESDVDGQIAAWIALIRRKYISAGSTLRPLDFGRTAQYFTLDSITKLSYGYAFGYLDRDEDIHEYIKTTEAIVQVLGVCSSYPVLQRFVSRPWMRRLMGPSPEDESGIGKLMGVARTVVGERYGPDAKEKRDMLGAFVRNGLTQRQAESEVLLQIIAGSDTTATAIRTTMLRLLTAPMTLAKLRQEMDAAVRAGNVSNPITLAEAKELPYLQAVIMEGIRINPPFTGLIQKEAPPGGDTVKGYFIPGGTKVGHSILAVQRNTAVFGPDADLFRPERFLEADAATRRRMEDTVQLAFGYGRWGCLGKSVAFVELNKIFVELFRVFDFSLVNPEKPWRSQNFNLWMQDEMWLRVTPREVKS